MLKVKSIKSIHLSWRQSNVLWKQKNQTNRCETILPTLAGVQSFDSFYKTCHCDGSVAFWVALLKLLSAIPQTINTFFLWLFSKVGPGSDLASLRPALFNQKVPLWLVHINFRLSNLRSDGTSSCTLSSKSVEQKRF